MKIGSDVVGDVIPGVREGVGVKDVVGQEAVKAVEDACEIQRKGKLMRFTE